MWCYFLRLTETELTILDDRIFNFILRSIKLVTAVLCYPEDFVCNDVSYNRKYKKNPYVW